MISDSENWFRVRMNLENQESLEKLLFLKKLRETQGKFWKFMLIQGKLMEFFCSVSAKKVI